LAVWPVSTLRLSSADGRTYFSHFSSVRLLRREEPVHKWPSNETTNPYDWHLWLTWLKIALVDPLPIPSPLLSQKHLWLIYRRRGGIITKEGEFLCKNRKLYAFYLRKYQGCIGVYGFQRFVCFEKIAYSLCFLMNLIW
jgi:hypothetical protein